MKTVFDIINEGLNLRWQGGTIHQALEEFSKADKASQDKVCNVIVANLKNLSTLDLGIAKEVMAIRTNYLTYKSLS